MGHAMAYLGGDQVLLFGGYDSGGNDDETWVYNLSANTWTNKDPSGDKSSARKRHRMAYIGGDQVLLFGGYDAQAFNNETWVYDLGDNAWTQDSNTSQPSARENPGLSESSMDGSSYLVLFGGNAGGTLNDETWTFGGGDYSLPVELTFFTATAGDGEVTLKWVTESERDNLGFNIYRSRSEKRDYQQITSELIPGAGNSAYRNEYEYVDKGLTNGVTYWYKLEDVDYDGLKTQHGPISATPTAKVRPTVFQLSQNYPNPFNPLTTIRYQIPEDGKVVLGIYNLLGQPIKTLVDAEQEAGYYQVEWDGKDAEGSRIGSGIYFYRFKTGLPGQGNFVQVKKMVVLR